MGLKLPGENDFYDVRDFNNNFIAVENAIESLGKTLSAKIESVSQEIADSGIGGLGVVSGIMSANGAMNLGFRPSAVIVMSREMGGNQRAAGAVHLTPWGRNIAMAVDAPSGNQTRRDATTAPETAVTTLEITATGFNVSGMFGSHNMHPTSAAFEQHPVSAQWPLRYIAFR
jgi:hypothetical protein